MSYFGKRPAIYANDSTNHKPVGLFPCSECGALVTEANKDTHTSWHKVVETRIKAAEDKPAQVVINNPPYNQPYIQPIQPYSPNTFPTYPTYTPWLSGGNISSSSATGSVSFTGMTAGTTNVQFIDPDDDGDCDCDCGGACE